MTIHTEHPFLPPEGDRDPIRRLRGRLGGTVSLWTTGSVDGSRAGLTVSSLLVAAGDPAHVLALVDPDSDFAETFEQTGVAVFQLLEWQHRTLAEAFAGLFPAPGGAFKLGTWVDTDWGPRLTTASAWAGVRSASAPSQDVGWGRLIDCVIEHVEVEQETAPLIHRRGRYVRPD